MKIRGITLKQIGPHTDTELSQLGDGLTVIYGRNEVGKSTLLGAIRGLLFGRLTSEEPKLQLHSDAKAAMLLESTEGSRFHLHRDLRRRSAPRLVSASGQVHSGQSALVQVIPELAEVEALIFQSIFTFQLAELKDLGHHRKLQSSIYSLGTSGHVSPIEAEIAIEQQAKNIYNPDKRARNPQLVKCLQEIETIQADLLEQGDTPAAYQEAVAKLAQLREEQHAVEAALVTLDQEHQQLAKYLAVHPRFEALTSLEGQLQAFGKVVFPTQEQQQMVIELESVGKESAVRLRDLEADLQMQRQLMQETKLDTSHFTHIEQLRTHVNAVPSIEQQLLQREEKIAEVTEIEEKLEVLKGKLTPFWQGRNVATMSMADAEFTQVQKLVEAFEQIEQKHAQLTDKWQAQALSMDQKARALSTYGVSLEEGLEAIEQAFSQLSLELQEIDEGEQVLANIERMELELEHTVTERKALERTMGLVSGRLAAPSPTTKVPLFVFLTLSLGLVGIGIWLMIAFTVWAGLTSAGIGMALLWLEWIRSRSSTSGPVNAEMVQMQQRMDWLMQKEADMGQERDRLQKQLTAQVEVEDIATVAAVRSALQVERQELERRTGTLSRIQPMLQDYFVTRSDYDALTASRQSLTRDRSALEAQWQRQLEAVGLPGYSLQPPLLLSELTLIQDIKDLYPSLIRKQQALAALEASVQTYLADAIRTLEACGSTVEAKEAEAVERDRASSLRHQFEEIRGLLISQLKLAEIEEENWNQHIQRRDQVEQLARRVEKERETHETHLRQLSDHLTEMGFSNLENYQQTRLQLADVQVLQANIRDRRMELYGLCGGEKGYEAAVKALTATSPEMLERTTETCAENITHKQVELAELMKRMAELERQIGTWTDRKSTTDLRFELTQLKSERAALAKQWGAHRIAAYLLKQTREAYERERRPKSIERASEVFREITQGRYQNLYTRVDEQKIPQLFCVDRDGYELSLEALSRGSKEQVYLAVRLALVREYMERGIVLPVVLDDPMVNFDSTRLSHFFRALTQEAELGQMLYLTCQESVLKLAEEDPRVQVIHVG